MVERDGEPWARVSSVLVLESGRMGAEVDFNVSAARLVSARGREGGGGVGDGGGGGCIYGGDRDSGGLRTCSSKHEYNFKAVLLDTHSLVAAAEEAVVATSTRGVSVVEEVQL